MSLFYFDKHFKWFMQQQHHKSVLFKTNMQLKTSKKFPTSEKAQQPLLFAKDALYFIYFSNSTEERVV